MALLRECTHDRHDQTLAATKKNEVMMSSVLELITCFHWPCVERVNRSWCAHMGSHSKQRQARMHICISVLAHAHTDTHIFLMRLPRQTFIDPVNLTAGAVRHSIYLCLIPIKPGLWTNWFSKPITLEGDKITTFEQPFFPHEISNQN